MRRLLLALVLAAGIAAIAYALLGGRDDRRPRPLPEQEEAPEPVAPTPSAPIPPTATTAPLVIRVKVPGDRALPPGTQAGYRRFGNRRLRPAAADGTFRFSDAPTGSIELIVEAEGYRADPVAVEVEPNQTNEAVVVLEAPSPPPTK